MTPQSILIFALIAFYNVVVFCVYWWDKDAARNSNRRIRESTLLTLAFLMGTPGALLARNILRHKTRKQPFTSRLNRIAWVHAIATAAGIAFAVTPVATMDIAGGLLSTLR